jgi:hypothetical protein
MFFMDQPPTLREPFAPGQTPRKNNCLFGCLGILIGVPVLLVIIGYFVIMHTAVPLRLLANTLNHDKSLKIEGIGGSISKGFTIESIRYTNPAGNESVLEGLALQWGDLMRMNRNQELVIEKIGLRRAHIFVDTSNKSTTTKSTTTSSSSSGTTVSSSSSSVEKLNLFEIKNVDVREVVVESTTGDFKLELAQILMKGFRIKGNQLDLDALSVGSNFLDLHLEDAQPVTIDGYPVPFTRSIVGELKPEMHKSLTRKIDFTVELGAVVGQMVTRARGFNGAVEAVNLGPLGHETITFKDFTPADFLAPDFSGPVSKLSMVIQTPEKAAEAGPRPANLESGNFTLGTTLFTMAPQVLNHDTSKPDELADPIIATSQRDGLEITVTLNQSQQPPFFQVGLSSKPSREPRDLIALLWFGKPYNDLTADQVATVDATEKRNFPPQQSQSEK